MKIPVSYIVSENVTVSYPCENLNKEVNAEMHRKHVHQENEEIIQQMIWLKDHNINYTIQYELESKEELKPAGHIVDGRSLWEDFNFYRCSITMFFIFDTDDDAAFFKISN